MEGSFKYSLAPRLPNHFPISEKKRLRVAWGTRLHLITQFSYLTRRGGICLPHLLTLFLAAACWLAGWLAGSTMSVISRSMHICLNGCFSYRFAGLTNNRAATSWKRSGTISSLYYSFLHNIVYFKAAYIWLASPIVWIRYLTFFCSYYGLNHKMKHLFLYLTSDMLI